MMTEQTRQEWDQNMTDATENAENREKLAVRGISQDERETSQNRRQIEQDGRAAEQDQRSKAQSERGEAQDQRGEAQDEAELAVSDS